MEKKSRLTKSADFQRVYRQGKSVAGRYAVLYYFERAGEAAEGTSRLGLSVSKKVGTATVRNLVKRTLKECFRARQEQVAANYDYVIIARPGLAEYLDKSQFEDVVEMITELFRRANLIRETD